MWEKPEAQYSKDEKELDKLCPAWAKCALAWRTNMRHGHNGDSIRCFSFVEVYELLEALRRRFEAGNTLALLEAVQRCADENVPLPTWLANAFTHALKSFHTLGGPGSLDDVFYTVPRPLNTQNKAREKADSERRDRVIGATMWRCAWHLAVDDESITSMDGLLDRLLLSTPPDGAAFRQWPVEKSKARKLILMIDKNQGERLNWPASKSLSQFLTKRRKR